MRRHATKIYLGPALNAAEEMAATATAHARAVLAASEAVGAMAARYRVALPASFGEAEQEIRQQLTSWKEQDATPVLSFDGPDVETWLLCAANLVSMVAEHGRRVATLSQLVANEASRDSRSEDVPPEAFVKVVLDQRRVCRCFHEAGSKESLLTLGWGAYTTAKGGRYGRAVCVACWRRLPRRIEKFVDRNIE